MPEAPALPFDIIAPAAPAPLPPDYTWYIVGGAVLLVALLAMALRRVWRTRHRRRARTTLRRAEAAYRSGTLSEREAAFAIARALMSGFQTRQLRAGADSETNWADFVAHLDTLRYTTQTTDITPLFAQARHWLRRPSAEWSKGQPC
jgi:hypothetical protein